MNLACLFGRHWPAAALSDAPVIEGYQSSHCADCGAAMEKTGRADWRARDPWTLRTLPLALIGSRMNGPQSSPR